MNNGPYRALNDPENAVFLRTLAEGRVPAELLPPPPPAGTPPGAPTPIDVKLEDNRDQEYVPPDYIAFSGGGNSLKAEGGEEEVEAVGASEGEKREGGGEGGGERSDSVIRGGGLSLSLSLPTSFTAAPVVDESAEVVKSAVRTLTGGRIVISLNLSHTIRDLSYLINQETSTPPGTYVLMEGFPPKRLTDGTVTIESAGLKGGQVQMKKV